MPVYAIQVDPRQDVVVQIKQPQPVLPPAGPITQASPLACPVFTPLRLRFSHSERRVQMLEAEHMQAVKQLEMSEAYRQRTERDLAGRLLEIEGIQLQLRQTERFAPEASLIEDVTQVLSDLFFPPTRRHSTT